MQILVVMPEHRLRKKLLVFLERKQHAAAACPTVLQAVKRLEEHAFEAVVSATELSDGDGKMLYTHVRVRWPQLPIVFMDDNPYYVQSIVPHRDPWAEVVSTGQPFTDVLADIEKLRRLPVRVAT